MTAKLYLYCPNNALDLSLIVSLTCSDVVQSVVYQHLAQKRVNVMFIACFYDLASQEQTSRSCYLPILVTSIAQLSQIDRYATWYFS